MCPAALVPGRTRADRSGTVEGAELHERSWGARPRHRATPPRSRGSRGQSTRAWGREALEAPG
eukprot:10414442-Alexandrium_andersonii.AAC.1